jgi:hypothetical protein
MKPPAPASSPQEAMRVNDQTGRVTVFMQRVVLDTEIQMENPSRCRFRGGQMAPCRGARVLCNVSHQFVTLQRRRRNLAISV